MDSKLKGKVIVITGASGGIGGAMAQRFAEEGARLVLHYRTGRERVESLHKELAGTDILLVQADLTKERDAKRLFAAVVKKFGRVDTLVANAGSWETRDIPLHEMSLKQWRATMDAVLTSVFFSVREFLKIAARQKRGNMVLISSTAGIFGEAGHADYAAAKSAIAFGLTRTLKNEMSRLAPHTKDYCGGRVNCICPGWTIVPRNAGKLTNAATVKKVLATMALPQIARPDDIAQLAVFLASDVLSRHLTGQTIPVAGGMEGRMLWREEELDAGIA